MSSSQPRIAIIGAGPAGLTLGLLLHKRGIPFTIFELRQKPTDAELAKPSGMLDLHEESGIAAIQECGLYDDFLQLTGECSEAQIVADKEANILYEDRGGLSDRPEIARHALMKLLIANVPGDTIQWGSKLLSARPSTAEIELDFGGDSGPQRFDLVVGADGSWSKVRSLLTSVKPTYAGTQCITLTLQGITKKHPQLARLVGEGSFVALGSRHGLISQRGPLDSARIYLMLTSDDEHFPATAGLAGQSAASSVVQERLLDDASLLGTWSATLKALVQAACEEEARDNPGAALDIRPMYILPVGNSWEHRANATLIGDAAHLMGPWAGEGVNLAMWDALLLARGIASTYESGGQDAVRFMEELDPVLKEFERDLVERAREKAGESYSNGQMMFGEDGAKSFADFFKSLGPPPE